MIAIKTKKQINISAENIFKTATFQVELVQWLETNEGLFSTVTYNKISQKTEEVTTANEDGTSTTSLQTFDVKEEFEKKIIQLTIDKYNQLCAYCETLFVPNMTPFEKQQLRKKVGLLFYVTNDFLTDKDGVLTDKLIFGTVPSDFEIV